MLELVAISSKLIEPAPGSFGRLIIETHSGRLFVSCFVCFGSESQSPARLSLARCLASHVEAAVAISSQFQSTGTVEGGVLRKFSSCRVVLSFFSLLMFYLFFCGSQLFDWLLKHTTGWSDLPDDVVDSAVKAPVRK